MTSTAAVGRTRRTTASRPRSCSSISTSGLLHQPRSHHGGEHRVVYDLINVVQGDAKRRASAHPRQTRAPGAAPAARLADARHRDALTDEGVARVIARITGKGVDWVICDSPASIERGATLARAPCRCRDRVCDQPGILSSAVDRIISLLGPRTEMAGRGQAREKHLLLPASTPRGRRKC